jgi:Ulp1 family protease
VLKTDLTLQVFIPMRVNTHWFLVVLNSDLRVVQVLNSDEKFNADIVHIVRSMVRLH